MAYRFKARSTTPGDYALKSAALAVVAGYPAESDVRDGTLYGTSATEFEGTLLTSGGIDPVNIVGAEWVVVGRKNYVGGEDGTYPTTATSQAAQLLTDQAAVTAARGNILDTATVLSIAGTFNLDDYEQPRNTNLLAGQVLNGLPFSIWGVSKLGSLIATHDTDPPTRSENWMSDAVSQLIDRFDELASIQVIYRRGALATAAILATPRREPNMILGDEETSQTAFQNKDFVIRAERLVFIGQTTPFEPQSGDRIEEVASGNIYEVTPLFRFESGIPRQQDVYESIGPEGAVFRIHGNLIGSV